MRLIGLKPVDYEHPLDREALEKLKKNVAFRKIMAEVIHQGVERIYRIQYTGSCLKIDADDYPDIHVLLRETADTLGMIHIPDLYMQWDYQINAFTTGEKEPLMVLNSGVIDMLEPTEQRYIIGHELGHIMSHHVLYHMIVDSLTGIIDFGSLINAAIELPMYHWFRMSELTADRAGLLACQDFDATVRAMIKMAGLPKSQYDKVNVRAFIDQARDFNEKNTGFMDETFKFLAIANSSHPWLVLRASELLKWVEAGEYDRILREKRVIQCSRCDGDIPADSVCCPICNSTI